MKKHKLYVFIIFIFSLIIILFLTFNIVKNKNRTVYTSTSVSEFDTVILDAGHGGYDGGAVAPDGTLEKDLNLQITKKLKVILELYGYNVILTRIDDNSLHDSDAKTLRQQKVSDIHNREKIIKSNPDTVFVSIHQNNFYDSGVHGAQIFYSDNNPLSHVLAQSVNNSVTKFIQPDNNRGIKKSGTEIYLLYHSDIPSIMIECGFLSNYNDLNKLKNNEFQKEITLAITEGILNYSKG